MLKNSTVEKKLKILFVSSEVAPLSKIGGLADVCWSLPRELVKLGHDVRIFTPNYGFIVKKKFNVKNYLEGLTLKTSKEDIVCNVKQCVIPGNVKVYLLENMEYFEKRANIYGYSDDSRRWFLLSKMVLEFLKREKWIPDLIHSHDWLTGIISDFIKNDYKNINKINRIASLFTIHNLNIQGNFGYWEREKDQDERKKKIKDFYDKKVLNFNGLKRGIIYSDIVTTVSENYAREILTPEYGASLDKLLNEERMKLFGVINGIDYAVFNPKTDSDIWVNYDKNSLDKKIENKLRFQKEFGLEIDKNIPVIGFVGRFSAQKGLGLIRDSIEMLFSNLNFQFIIVGGANEEWQGYFYNLMKKYPKRVGGYLQISKIIGQQVYAASDIFVYPSLFEPCGLAHLIAMRYGSVPVVRKTGGLADTVEDFNPDTMEGNGFVFEKYDKYSLIIQITRALETYKNKDLWKQLQEKVMRLDFSWKNSAQKYVELYEKAIERHRRWRLKEKIISPQNPLEVKGETSIDYFR